MKKAILSLSILAAMSGASQAQSNVTLYGNVDAAVAVTNSGAPGAANAVSVTSGTAVASYWGIRGSEDMGGGLKAMFVLQSGLDVDTGAAKTYSGNPSTATPAAPGGAPVTGLFNMRSFVGLEGNFGSVSLGRDYTPLYWVLVDADPFRLGLYGNSQEIVLLSGTGSDRFGRASNAVFYVSPKFAGFQARVMYSLGSESAGAAGTPPKDANRMWAVSGHYVAGPLVVSGAYQQIELPTVAGTAFTGSTGTRKDAIIAARYIIGDYSVGAGYFNVKQPVPNSDARDVWLGGTATLGTGTFMAMVQRMRQDAAVGAEKKGTIFGLGYIHPLSKRTALFATYGEVINSSTATFALTGSDNTVAPGAAGAHVKALATGIRHSF